jgi:hypothetical protein
MWGASAAPFAGSVLECRVSAVRLFKCGTRADALKRCFPFAQIDLVVLPPTLSANAAINTVYAEFFPGDKPARFCIQCGLVKPDALIEISTIAHVGPAG